MNKKLFYVLIFLMVLVWGINIYFYLESKKPNTIYIPGQNGTTTTTAAPGNVTIMVSKNCSLNSNCSWEITNCCQETAGAHWECMNLKESVIRCEGNVLCPQFISPKPTNICSCMQGECQG